MNFCSFYFKLYCTFLRIRSSNLSIHSTFFMIGYVPFYTRWWQFGHTQLLLWWPSLTMHCWCHRSNVKKEWRACCLYLKKKKKFLGTNTPDVCPPCRLSYPEVCLLYILICSSSFMLLKLFAFSTDKYDFQALHHLLFSVIDILYRCDVNGIQCRLNKVMNMQVLLNTNYSSVQHYCLTNHLWLMTTNVVYAKIYIQSNLTWQTETTHTYQRYSLCILLKLDFCPYRKTHLLPLWAPCQKHTHTADCTFIGSAQHLFSCRRLSTENLNLIVFNLISNSAGAMFYSVWQCFSWISNFANIPNTAHCTYFTITSEIEI